MARVYKNRHSRDGFILNFSRPVRDLIRRFSFGLLIFISIILVLTGKSKNDTVSLFRTQIIDFLSPIMEAVLLPFNIIKDSGDSFKTYIFVHSKNAELTAENKKLRLQIARLYQERQENEQLHELLNYVKELDYEYITAKVVGNASGPFTRSSLVNAGENDGVLKGQAVVMNGGLVGRVVEVGSSSSRILLLTDINSKIPVISMDSRERSILSGNNTENPKLLYLPKESKITDGEIMITSGDGDMIPPGLMVGKAAKLSDGSYEVLPFVSWHHIEYVSVLSLQDKDLK
jgi:rod shape-determining protein MreC